MPLSAFPKRQPADQGLGATKPYGLYGLASVAHGGPAFLYVSQTGGPDAR